MIFPYFSTLSNFKDTVLLQGSSKQGKYNNLVFAGMDYSVDEDEAMRLKQKSLYTGLVVWHCIFYYNKVSFYYEFMYTCTI